MTSREGTVPVESLDLCFPKQSSCNDAWLECCAGLIGSLRSIYGDKFRLAPSWQHHAIVITESMLDRSVKTSVGRCDRGVL